MAKAVENTNEEEKGVIYLEVIKGGKEPPSTGDDWLSNLAPHTVFLAKSRNPRSPEEMYNLVMFQKLGNTEKAVVVITPSMPTKIHVDPGAFVNSWRLFENLGLLIDPQHQEETGGEDERDRVQEDPGVPAGPVE